MIVVEATQKRISMKRISLLLALMVFSAPQARAADRYANVHSVAVISVLGDGIALRQVTDLTQSAIAPIAVFDAKTGKKLDYGTASFVAPSLLQGPMGLLPCDKRIWPQDPANPDENEARQIRADLMAAVTLSLSIALKSAKLSDKAPDEP